ncbi:MAG: glycosyltransferase family 2 protein, partial [Phycisphaerae bacterium]
MTENIIERRANRKSSYKDISISVFMPCYNEQENVERVVSSALNVLSELDCEFEVIIVNDGSSDRTGKIADEIAAKNPAVKVVHHPQNLGYGAALQSGFRKASKKLVFYTDGDGQFDMGQMPELLPLMNEYDIVSCYRINRQDNL